MKGNNRRVLRACAFMLTLALGFALCACAPATTQANEGQPFVFLFMSDTQADPQAGDYSGFGSLLKAAISKNSPSLLIFGGDTVNDAADEDEWGDFWRSVGDSLKGIPVAAAAGNHDGSKYLAGRFDWPASAPEKRGQGYFYSFDMDSIHFTVMDGNIMGAANEEDIAWLKADLSSSAATNADWRVAVCHQPFWPVAAIPKDMARAQTLREYFLPLLEEYGVDLLLVGHENVYSRCEPENGPPQVMTASGGKASYATTEQPYIVKTADAPNYVRVSADSDKLEITAFDASGAAIDSFTITRGD